MGCRHPGQWAWGLCSSTGCWRGKRGFTLLGGLSGSFIGHRITGPPPTVPSSLAGWEPGKACSQQHAKPIWRRAYLTPGGVRGGQAKMATGFASSGEGEGLSDASSLGAPWQPPVQSCSSGCRLLPAPSTSAPGESSWHEGPLGQPGFASPASASDGGSVGKAVCVCLLRGNLGSLGCRRLPGAGISLPGCHRTGGDFCTAIAHF